MTTNFPAKSYPDLGAVDYALSHATAINDSAAIRHLNRVKERSLAFAGGYGTHIPLLAAVVAVSHPGPIVELGAGNSSSPLLSEMCRAMNRRLTSLEREGPWYDTLDDLIGGFRGTIGHDRLIVPNPSQWVPTIEQLFGELGKFSVVFADHGLDRSDGAAVLEYLADKSELVVIHDTRNTWFAGVDDALDGYKYRFDYVKMAPCTTVVSNYLDVASIFG